MKKYLLLVASVVFLASCSSPKYAYYFDHYDYNSGKKNIETSGPELAGAVLSTPDVSPLKIDQKAITASAETRIRNVEHVPVMENAPAMDERVFAEKRALLEEKYSSLTRAEKKEFRKELKAEVKSIVKAKKKGESIKSIMENKAMDSDLKMALIFGIVGIVLSAFGGVNSVFWVLGTISVIVALVFLIIWIGKQ